jgi:hypothetical protein
VSGLEQDAARLQAKAVDRDRESGDLQECVALFNVVLQETNARLHDVLEDNVEFPHLLFALGGSQLKAPPGPQRRAHGG